MQNLDSSKEINSIENLKGLHISSIDDDNEDVEDEQEMLIEEDDEEDEQEPVTLGFLEKPKNSYSLLRHLFPSKAGGVPVMCSIFFKSF